MKTIGMIGGIGPESTIDYYKRLLDGTQKRNPGGPAPSIIINSIDLQKGLDLLGANRLSELTDQVSRHARITGLDALTESIGKLSAVVAKIA